MECKFFAKLLKDENMAVHFQVWHKEYNKKMILNL